MGTYCHGEIQYTHTISYMQANKKEHIWNEITEIIAAIQAKTNALKENKTYYGDCLVIGWKKDVEKE